MLTPDNIAALDQRARQVGAAIGWQLRFTIAPNPAYVGLVASDETIGDEIIILGARGFAERSGGGEVRDHRKDNNRIRNTDTVGKRDPYPPKG